MSPRTTPPSSYRQRSFQIHVAVEVTLDANMQSTPKALLEPLDLRPTVVTVGRGLTVAFEVAGTASATGLDADFFSTRKSPMLTPRALRLEPQKMERATGLEPATSSLGSLHSTN